MNTLNNPNKVGEANKTFLRVQKWITIMFAIISIVNIPLILEYFAPEILNNPEIWHLVCGSLSIITQMIISIYISIKHKRPTFSLSKFTLRLYGLPKFKDDTHQHKKRALNKIFIESHIKNLSDKIEVIDINFGPKNTQFLDEVQKMHNF